PQSPSPFRSRQRSMRRRQEPYSKVSMQGRRGISCRERLLTCSSLPLTRRAHCSPISDRLADYSKAVTEEARGSRPAPEFRSQPYVGRWRSIHGIPTLCTSQDLRQAVLLSLCSRVRMEGPVGVKSLECRPPLSEYRPPLSDSRLIPLTRAHCTCRPRR